MKTRGLTFSVCKTIIYSLFIGVILGVFLSPKASYAASEGPFTADTVTGTNWVADGVDLQTDAATSDNSRCVYDNTAQDDLILTNFGFTIPLEATIDGITVTREGSGTANPPTGRTYRIGLTKDAGTLAGTRKSAQALPKNTDDTVDVGGAADTWDAGLTPAQVNAVGFGLLIDDDNTTANPIRFDLVTVTVTYTIIKSWDNNSGGGDNNWNTATNWNPEGVPAASEPLLFTSGAAGRTDPCTINVATNSLGTFTVDSGYTGTITQDANVTCTTLDIGANATWTVNTASVAISCVDFTNAGTFNNSQTNTISASGNVTITSFGATLTNNTLTMTGDGKYINSTVSLGNLVIAGGTDVSRNYISTNNLTLDGTFTLNAGMYFTTTDGTDRNLTTVSHITINGLFYANSSTITMTAAGTGNFVVDAAATFDVGTSTVDLQQTGEIQRSGWLDFYNLTCGASTKTTTINMGAADRGIVIVDGGTLTVGAGILSDGSTFSQIVAFRATGTVVNTNGGQIDVTTLKFEVGTHDMSGGNYTTSTIQVANTTTVNLTGDVTASGDWDLAFQTEIDAVYTVNLNGYNIISSGDINIGQSGQTTQVGQMTCGNILPNADFESSTVGLNQEPDAWPVYQTLAGYYGIDDNQGRGKSFYFVDNSAWQWGSNIHADDNGPNGTDDWIPVEEGKHYNFQVYLKTDNDWDGEVTLTISWLQNPTTWEQVMPQLYSHSRDTGAYPAANTDWYIESVGGTAPTGAHYAQFALEIVDLRGDGTGKIYVDDMWAGLTSGNILPNADFDSSTPDLGEVQGEVPDNWAWFEEEAGCYGTADDPDAARTDREKCLYAMGRDTWSFPTAGSNIHPDVDGTAIHIAVEATKEYTFRAYFKTDSAWEGESALSIQFLTSDGSVSWDPTGAATYSHADTGSTYPAPNQIWTLETTVSAEAPADATHAQFAFEMYSTGASGATGKIYVDNMWAGLTSDLSSNIEAAGLHIYRAYTAGKQSSVDLGSGTHTFSGNVTIEAPSGDAEAHLTLSTSTLEVGGNWDNSGTFTANTGTVIFNGSGAQALSGTLDAAGKFYNLTIDNSAVDPGANDVDPSSAVEVANTLTVADGQFQPHTGSDFVDVSITTINGILAPDASAAITVSGDWTNNSGGTFTHGSGTVTFDGDGQSVTTGGSDGSAWNDLVVSGNTTTGLTFLDGFTAATFTDVTPNSKLYFKRHEVNLNDFFEITANDGLTLNGQAVGTPIILNRYDEGGLTTEKWEICPSGTGWNVDNVTVSWSINSAIIAIINDPEGGGDLLSSSEGVADSTINWFEATLVDMVSFCAIGYFDKVEVAWKTASEINNAGFNIYRSTTRNSGYIKINDGLIPGLGSSVIGREYRLWDDEVTNGITYYYKLEDVEFDGTSTMRGPIEVHPGLDSDGDGMTDDWENYYGLDMYLDDSQGDPDQDGLTNLEEFVAETDPITKIETQIVVGAVAQEPLRIIASNDYHIVMELVTTSFDLEEKIGNGEIYQLITIPDYIHGYTSEIGEPQVPAKGVLIGVPQDASADIGGSDYSFREYKTTYNIYPVPEITKVDGHLEEEFTIDQAAYSKDEYYPGNLVEVVYTGELRSQRVANIRFYPFQFNPHKSSLKFYERIRVEIVFGEESSSSSDTEIPGVAVPANDEPRLKLTLGEEGIYRLTGYDLVDAGLSLFWIDPAGVKLYNLGEEIPIKINGQADGQFDLDDEIVFFAEGIDTKYSGTNVYWLTYGGGAGLRMEENLGTEDDEAIIPDKFLSFYRYEEDKFYWPELEGGEDTDRWFFNTFIWGGREKDFNIALTNIVSDDEISQAKIKFTIHGFFDTRPYPNHHALIYLNDNLLEEALWSGQAEHILERDDISQSYLDDTSTITVKALLAPGAAYDLILPNYFEFEYWKNLVAEDNILRFNYEGEGTYLFEIPGFTSDDIEIFDITDKREVMYLANFEISDAYTASFKDNLSGEKEYIVMASDKMMSPESMEVDEPSNLRSTDNQADYIIITDQEFYYATLPLAYLRESLGLRTEVVKIDDVYDDFNFGIQSPYAIKNFLKFAYDNWQKPAPTYVLLVGDASYDYKDNLGRGKSNYVPTYLLWTPYAGETGSDNWFVCLDGEEDILPDMFIGRIPVRTYEEAQAVVEKIMDYEEKSTREDWMEKAVIVADNESIFEETSDELMSLLPRKFEARKLYIRDYPYPEVLTQKMVDGINEGALILNYVGHGSTELWADEQILDIQAIDLFNNADRLPIVVSMTCLDGFYLHAHQYPCMAETFLKKEQGGAVGTWSPTGMGLPQGHQILNKGLFEAFFDDNNIIFGSATTQAKISLFLQNGNRYEGLIHTYTLFGDPSLRLKIKKEKKPLPVVTLKKVEKTFQIQVEEEEETEETSGFEAIFDDVIANYELAKDWRDEDKEPGENYELPEAFENEGAGEEASLGPAIGAEGEDLLLGVEDGRPSKPARLIGKLSKAKGESDDDVTNLQGLDEPEIIATESSGEDTLQIEQEGSPSEKSLWLRMREAVMRFFERLLQ